MNWHRFNADSKDNDINIAFGQSVLFFIFVSFLFLEPVLTLKSHFIVFLLVRILLTYKVFIFLYVIAIQLEFSYS